MAFHSEMTEKIDHFAKWCIYFIYHLQSGVYAIYTTCASIGKMAPLVYISVYIYILTNAVSSMLLKLYIIITASEHSRYNLHSPC